MIEGEELWATHQVCVLNTSQGSNYFGKFGLFVYLFFVFLSSHEVDIMLILSYFEKIYFTQRVSFLNIVEYYTHCFMKHNL